MRSIKVAGIDPSLTHTGIAKGRYELDTGNLTIERVLCVRTEAETGKTVRRNSDDLRRASVMTQALYDEVGDCDIIFSEIPTGAQSARAALAFGIVVGAMAGITTSPGFKPAFVQVLPHQVKSSIPGGTKNTSKEEIIEWAVQSWPGAGWIEAAKGRKFDFPDLKLKLGGDAEHPADACAAINAGLLTDDCRNLLALFRKLVAQ
mgnify:CR=1 FL=1